MIHNTMITRSATVISLAETARTAKLKMRATLQVFPSKNLLATYMVRNATPVITVIRGLLHPAPKWACNKAMQNIHYEEGADTVDGNDVR